MHSLEIGSRIKWFVASNGERLIEGTLIVEDLTTYENLPYPMGSPIFHIRYFPSIVKDANPSVVELVQLGAENINYGEQVYLGKGNLNFYPSEVEEHIGLRPIEVLGAYHYSSGYSFNGGKVLHSWVSS